MSFISFFYLQAHTQTKLGAFGWCSQPDCGPISQQVQAGVRWSSWTERPFLLKQLDF